jgi:crotonobetainyl-CoA:carnitine CoA-transferase CaiB-like acyl-CoA transferase
LPEIAALDGIRILDLTRQMAGPYATLVLGDFGADIIKIESKGSGDPARGVGTHFVQGEGALFLTWNRNKRSLCLDLRDPRGREVVERLVATADVFIENYRPGIAEKMGLGYEQVHALNKRVVYCSVNAFGSEGPWKEMPGTDPIVQAMSGVMSVTGEPDGGPNLVGIPVADYISSMLAVQGVLLGLAARDRTGEGQHVEVSMLASLLFGLTTRIAPYFLTGEDPERFGGAHSQVVPYQAFETADGWVVAGVWGRGFDQFCRAIDRPELAEDPRFLTNPDRVGNREELVPILEDVFREHPKAYWEARFREIQGLFSPVNSFSDILESEQVAANDMLTTVEHPTVGTMRQMGPAVKLKSTPGDLRAAPPLLGQHSREVLLEFGWSGDDVDELVTAGVLVEASAVPEFRSEPVT